MRLNLRVAAAQGIALFTVAALALSACGSRTNRFAGNGYEFQYPGSWKPRANITFSAATAAGALSKEAVGLDDVNLAVLVTARLDRPVTPQTLGTLQAETTSSIRQLAATGGGRVTAGPERITMGGLPGFRFQLSGIQIGTARVDSRLVLAFQGSLEYLLFCQHTPNQADHVESACDVIMRTFRLLGR
jgi:hypothetical protein